ncbi:MAG: hypothetical protein ABIP54_01180 [Candidatus Andersenbacteria bacterium]
MKNTTLKSRTLFLLSAIVFFITGLYSGKDSTLDILIGGAHLLGIITFILGVVSLNKELREERKFI